MKKIKLMILFITLILVTGCGNKELVKNYDNMNISKDNINGYILDLRIYGSYDGKKVNEIIRITDYNNKEYKIEKTNINIDKEKEKEKKKGKENVNDDIETIYIKDGKTYIADESGNYVEGKSETYNNPSVYLEGLNNISKVEEPTEEKIGNNSYKLYKVEFKKSIMDEIIKDTVLKGMKIEKDVEGEVYIDKDGYVYRIIYSLEDITINANYFSINTVRPISIPSLDKGN